MNTYQRVIKVQIGFNQFRKFLTLECGHEVYRYSKATPEKVKCEYCNRPAWFTEQQEVMPHVPRS